ncbi:MAG: holo-ACP synthase [Acidimicrobiales bacterium]
MRADGIGQGPVRGIGIDAVDVERFRRVLRRRPAVAQRVFTEAERADTAARTDPVPGLAARFAAKEATLKALQTGIGGVPLRDVEVARDESGAPRLVLAGRAAELAASREIGVWHVSLTHTDTVAMAAVVAEQAGPTVDVDAHLGSP